MSVQALSNFSALPISLSPTPALEGFTYVPLLPSRADHCNHWWLLTNVTPGSHP